MRINIFKLSLMWLKPKITWCLISQPLYLII